MENPSRESALPAHYRDVQSPLASAMMLPNQDRPFSDNPEIKWAWELMPKMQLSATPTSPWVMAAEDAVYIGDGEAVAIQVYFQSASGAGDTEFVIQTSVTGDDEDFVDASVPSIAMQASLGDFTKIVVHRLTPDFCGYLRLKVSVSTTLVVWANHNVLGKGIL